MIKYSLWCLLILVVTSSLSNAATVIVTGIACEHQAVQLDCGPKHLVRIISANYGRNSKTICDDGVNVRNLACNSVNSLDIVKNRCEGKSSCIISASNTVFGDPCYLTVKYLEIQYTCVLIQTKEQPESPIANTETIDPLDILPVHIDNDDSKLHTFAHHHNTYTDNQHHHIFNRTNNPRFQHLTNQSENLDIQKTSNRKNGLKLMYPNQISTACEHFNIPMKIECKQDEFIHVVKANYGRTSRLLCNDHRLPVNCISPNAIWIVTETCEGKQNCTMKPENTVFGDPCIGIEKYLEVHYKCLPKDSQNLLKEIAPSGTLQTYGNSMSCEHGGKPIKIQCKANEWIQIIRANYGRTSRLRCNGIANLAWGVNCISQNAIWIISEMCDFKNNCTINGYNGLFGDPCVGVEKYLEIQYKCMLKDVPTPTLPQIDVRDNEVLAV